MSMELSAATWVHDYETTKAGVLTRRSQGTLLNLDEQRQLHQAVLLLERGLQTMQASPMAYEITISELSRRSATSLALEFAPTRLTTHAPTPPSRLVSSPTGK